MLRPIFFLGLCSFPSAFLYSHSIVSPLPFHFRSHLLQTTTLRCFTMLKPSDLQNELAHPTTAAVPHCQHLLAHLSSRRSLALSTIASPNC